MPRPVRSSGSMGAPTPDAAVAELDAGLDNVLFDVWLVSRAATALIDDAVRASGLDGDEFAIYSVLASTQGMTPTELAHWMAAPATTVSSYVKRFERRRHVRRVPHPGDGRSYRVQLTAAGRRAHQAAGTLFLPTLREVTRRLGPAAADTHHRLRRLHQAMTTIDDGRPTGQ
jgi:DNA-binding MarR family transcriptional regulator